MCRLAAWSGRTPRTAVDAFGADGVGRLVALGLEHRDGWGLAWRDEAGAPARTRSTSTAGEDPAFREALTTITTTAGLAHLRWATPGLPVVEANAHPFLVGDLAMAHNGGIYPLDRIGEILPADWEGRVAGTTDSERYVLAVAAQLAAGADPDTAVATTVRRIFDGWAPTSLNAVAVLPGVLLAVCAFDPGAHVGVQEPATDYYALRWRSDGDGVAVASSGVFPEGDPEWQPLPNPSVLVVPANGEPRVVPIDARLGGHRAEGADLR